MLNNTAEVNSLNSYNTILLFLVLDVILLLSVFDDITIE